MPRPRRAADGAGTDTGHVIVGEPQLRPHSARTSADGPLAVGERRVHRGASRPGQRLAQVVEAAPLRLDQLAGPPGHLAASRARRLSDGIRPVKNSSRFALMAASARSRARGGAAGSRASSRSEPLSSSHHSSRIGHRRVGGGAVAEPRRAGMLARAARNNGRVVIHLSPAIHRMEIRRADAPSRTASVPGDVLIGPGVRRPLCSQH
jgi:hypothetical protein